MTGDRALDQQLENLNQTVSDLAKSYEGNLDALLALLRTLEQLHRGIREHQFEPALPTNRQDLYFLLRNIEETGGWPYIERMRIKDILQRFLSEDSQVQK